MPRKTIKRAASFRDTSSWPSGLVQNSILLCLNAKLTNPLFFQCRNDEELNKLFCNVTIAQGGVLPNIHAVLLPKKSVAGKAAAAAAAEEE